MSPATATLLCFLLTGVEVNCVPPQSTAITSPERAHASRALPQHASASGQRPYAELERAARSVSGEAQSDY